MCIAFFTLNQPGYRLILASNRDEYLGRPTLPAEWHDFLPPPLTPTEAEVEANGLGNGNYSESEKGSAEAKGREGGRVLSGRDRAKPEGGTWLGISKDLKVGLITNIRLTPPAPHIAPLANPPSRGLLLKEFLSPNTSTKTDVATPFNDNDASDAKDVNVHEYLRSHLSSAGNYEGFNLLLFDLGSSSLPQVGYLTNRPQPLVKSLQLHIPAATATADGPDVDCVQNQNHDDDEVHCHGISNAPMFQDQSEDARWEKIVQGEERMKATLREWSNSNVEQEKDLVERIFGVLAQNIPIRQDEDLKRSTTIQPILLQVKDDSLPTTTTTTTATNGTGNISVSQTETQWKGTKTSTVILVKDDGETIFVERDIAELDQEGLPRKGEGERRFTFKGEMEAHS